MKTRANRVIVVVMTTKLRVHFDGRVLVPEEPVDLPVGQSVEVRIDTDNHTRADAGTPSAVLGAVRRAPHVSPEDVVELERAISEARLPIRQAGPFDERGG